MKHKECHAVKGNELGYEIRKWDGIAAAIVCEGVSRERNLVVDTWKNLNNDNVYKYKE